jgi:histidinol-phosphate aminotransferase
MPIPKKHLQRIVPYPPGKSLEEVKKELGIIGKVIKLNSNENPLGPSPKVLSALKEHLSQINLYPQASYFTLKEAIAKRWSVSPNQVVLGNGSNEVIEFVFKAYLSEGDEIIVSKPSFLMYEKFAQIYGVSIKEVPLTKELKHDLKGIIKALSSKIKAIFLDHPHNPTGSTLNREEWYEFLENLEDDVLLVIDEAYGEFIDDPSVPSGLEFLKKRKGTLILRTFSKAYGLAGLRLGYGIASEEIANTLEKVRQPFNVNALAVIAGLAALEDEEHLRKTIDLTLQGRKYLTEILTKFGFKVYPSQANFIMVDFGEKCDAIYQELLHRGILLRPLKAYGFPTCLRITIGLPEENEVLISNLREILKL